MENTLRSNQRLKSVDPIDLELRITTPWGRGGQSIEFLLSSSSGVLDHYEQKVPGEVVREPEKFKRRLFDQLEGFQNRLDPDDEVMTPREIERELRAIGCDLYQGLFPPAMQALYREFHNRVKSLLIVSDEPWIPWEILYPAEFDDDDFLCMKYQMSRWLTGAATLKPEKKIKGLLGLSSNARSDLNFVESELGALQFLVSNRRGLQGTFEPQVTPDQFLRLLEEQSFDLLHFAGHGAHQEGFPADDRIQLEERNLRARQLPPEAMRKLRRERPFVFLNSCQGGRLGSALQQVEGWAPRWVRRCGCSAFLAPLWSVDDRRATEFAIAVYEGLTGGQSLGEAVFQARHRLRDSQPGEITYLAYSLYGHPNAIVVFGDENEGVRSFLETSNKTPSSSPLPFSVSTQGSTVPRSAHPNSGRLSKQRFNFRFSTPLALASLAVLCLVVVLTSFINRPSGEMPLTDSVVEEEAPIKKPEDLVKKDRESKEREDIEAEKIEPPPVKESSPVIEPAPAETGNVVKSVAPETWPLSVVVPGRIVFAVLNRKDKEIAPKVSEAVEVALGGEELMKVFTGFQTRLSSLTTRQVQQLMEGDLQSIFKENQSPEGAEYLVLATASYRAKQGMPVTTVSMTLTYDLVSAEQKSVLITKSKTATGAGPSLEQALIQAAGRCLNELGHYLER